jgi:diacylglycerol kinase family enzyme
MRDTIPAFINPAAGNADAARGALEAVGRFDIRDVEPQYLVAAVRGAVAFGASRILVAGGDGSVCAAAEVLVGTRVELAILPGGTLNHLARDLGVPTALDDAARLAAEGSSVTIDAATVNGRLFLNTSSVGAYVTFVRARERLERRLSYSVASLVAGLRLLFRLPVFRVSLIVEGVRREYVTPLLFVGVGERELKLPELGGRLAGGQRGLHVMVIRRRSGARTLAMALAAMARGVEAVARTPALDAFLVDACVVQPHMLVAALDGELVQLSPPLEYRYQPDALRVVLTGAYVGG